jgi:hypothetical protein
MAVLLGITVPILLILAAWGVACWIYPRRLGGRDRWDVEA